MFIIAGENLRPPALNDIPANNKCLPSWKIDHTTSVHMTLLFLNSSLGILHPLSSDKKG